MSAATVGLGCDRCRDLTVDVAANSQSVPFRVSATGGSMHYSESCREAFSRKGWPEGAFEAIHGGEESLVDNDIAVNFVEGRLDQCVQQRPAPASRSSDV